MPLPILASSLLVVLAMTSIMIAPVTAGHGLELERAVSDATLPKAISDHTATLGGSNRNAIYIAGGCDDPNGNTWNDDWATFACGSVSSSFYSFTPETNEFTTLPDMPRGRYRHAAVAVNNQIWLVGGRSLDDALLAEVDVFDIASEEWMTYTLPEGYAASDLGGWATETHAFFAGGYDTNYTALTRVYSIDVDASSNTDLVIVDNGSLLTARGDVAATVNLEKGYAYISGGFTHENNFCEPLSSVERYSLPPGDTWIAVASLPTARADKAMVEFKGHTIAMGGERAPENVCETNTTLAPGEKSEAVDDIEVLNDDDSTWQILATLPEDRFRFAAAVYKDTIYTFGGQQSFDAGCNCLKTVDEVVSYLDVSEPEDEDDGHTHEDGTVHTPESEEADGVITSDGNASDAMTFKSVSLASLIALVVGSLWVV